MTDSGKRVDLGPRRSHPLVIGSAPEPPPIEIEIATDTQPEGKELSENRKWSLLFIFCVAQFFDTTARSGVFALTDRISRDLNIPYENSTWVINSYSLTFAAFLPLWGRAANLFSATPVFTVGFFWNGIMALVQSFLPDQYSFLFFRAIGGIFASATALVAEIFDNDQKKVAFMYLTVVSSLANSCGLVIGGAFGAIPNTGQMAGWRWFLRAIGLFTTPFAFVVYFLCPQTKGSLASSASKWTQFDIPGCLLLLTSNIALIIGLTFGATYGWISPAFLVPFLISWPMLIGFFFYEARLPEGYAIIPASFWRLPNVALLSFIALEILAYWIMVQLPLVERWESVDGDPPLIAALRAFPSGLAAFLPALLLPKLIPKLNLRWLLFGGLSGTAIGQLLYIFCKGNTTGSGYFKWIIPAFLVGSSANQCAITAVSMLVVLSVPPAMSGVVSAIVQVSLSMGCVIDLAVQAGLLTIYPGGLSNWANLQASYWFQFGWIILDLGLLLFCYKNVTPALDLPPDPSETENGKWTEKVEEGESVDPS